MKAYVEQDEAVHFICAPSLVRQAQIIACELALAGVAVYAALQVAEQLQLCIHTLCCWFEVGVTTDNRMGMKAQHHTHTHC